MPAKEEALGSVNAIKKVSQIFISLSWNSSLSLSPSLYLSLSRLRYDSEILYEDRDSNKIQWMKIWKREIECECTNVYERKKESLIYRANMLTFIAE